jgi:hypothetical protein
MNGIYPEAWLRMHAAETERTMRIAQRRELRKPPSAWQEKVSTRRSQARDTPPLRHPSCGMRA